MADRFRYQITVSEQAAAILEHLVELGIYGRTTSEVIKRLLDGRLAEFIETPKFKI